MGVQRTATVSAAVLAAGLALTACGSSGGGPVAAGGGTSAASSPAAAGSSAPAATSSPSGAPAQASGSTDGSGGTAAAGGSARCGTGTVSLTVTGPSAYATAHGTTTATVRVVNTSASSCTLYGYPGVTVVDDQGKSAPITATRETAEAAAAAHVLLKPGQGANALLRFDDINTEGSASGEHTCGVQASTVRVILPDTTKVLAAKVEGGVDGGTLNVCGGVRVQPFEAASR